MGTRKSPGGEDLQGHQEMMREMRCSWTEDVQEQRWKGTIMTSRMPTTPKARTALEPFMSPAIGTPEWCCGSCFHESVSFYKRSRGACRRKRGSRRRLVQIFGVIPLTSTILYNTCATGLFSTTGTPCARHSRMVAATKSLSLGDDRRRGHALRVVLKPPRR